MIFDGSIPKDMLPEAGDIIFVPITPKTPYGFLGKVKSINKNGNIEVRTETADLTEIFEELSISTMLSLADKLLGCYDENGNPVEYEIIEGSKKSSTRENWEIPDIKHKIPIKFHDGDVLSLEGAITMSLSAI